MASSFIRVVLHTTFGTKYRQPFISPDVEQALWQFLDSRLRAMECRVYKIGGVMDHVHLLHGLPRQHSVAKVVQDVKSRSSCWMKGQGYPDFSWQIGYACHSVDYRNREGVERYIRDQKERHYGTTLNYLSAAELTFEQEYKTILDSFELEYDDRYLLADS